MIWYLDHSAIAVETNNHLLLFDLFGKTLQPPKGMGLAQGFVNPDELRDKDVVIFVSHEHPDHFDPAIFSLRDRLKRVRFVLPEEFDEIYQGDLFAAPNQTYRLPDMTVTTFESTDIGLAYLVEVDDKRIYHAGDLNWWHWEGEEEEFNLDQAKRYQQQMQLLADALDGNHLDLACIPVDPRLHSDCLRGLLAFDSRVFAKNILPIHFWGRFFGDADAARPPFTRAVFPHPDGGASGEGLRQLVKAMADMILTSVCLSLFCL